MTYTHKFRSMAAIAALAGTCAAGGAQAELSSARFEVVAGNHVDSFTQRIVLPFFNEQLPELSGGKLSANAVPFTELGLSGYEIMQLLKLGTNDISNAVIGYMTSESPIVEGLELPGLTSDLDLFREAQVAYLPILSRELNDKFNSRLLWPLTHPKLQAYCKLTEEEAANFSLATMKGKKIRVHSTSFANFVEGMGGIPVTMAFADVIPSLERGVLDCALTSPTAAYGAGFPQVTNYVVDLPAGYSTQIYVMNNDSWNKLNTETQDFLTAQFSEINQQMRQLTEDDTVEAAGCLHDGPCANGEPGKMGLITLSAEDEAQLKDVVKTFVLDRWAASCGAGCGQEWNDTMGVVLGMHAGE